MNDLLLLWLALAASAFFSGTEIAFTTLSSARVMLWKQSRRLGSGWTQRYFDRPDALLITLLVGTNLANISFTSLATLLATERGLPEWLFVPAITLIILLLGETLPKLLFHEWTNLLFPLLALPARLFHLLLWPAVAPVALIFRRGGAASNEQSGLFQLRAHLDELAQDLETAGHLGEKESRMIGRALQLRERTVGEFMTPRTSIIALQEGAEPQEFGRMVIEHGYSCLPVYRESLDRIIGYVNARDLFSRPGSLGDILRSIAYVPESMPARDLLARFGRERLNLAVVLDEYGGTAGMISLEDLLENLVGSIEDEHDADRRDWVTLKDGRFFVKARLRLDVVEEKLGLRLPAEVAETLGGWICERLGRIPDEGEVVQLDSLRIRIVAATPQELRHVILQPTERKTRGHK